MRRIFLPPEQFSESKAQIIGADHQHLVKVLRAIVGDEIILLNNLGDAFRATLKTIGKAETTAVLEERIAPPPEPKVKIIVAQSLGKGDKFEQVVQHGTEAGASEFIPIRAERCVVDIPDSRLADRMARWQAIAKAAAEQSGRGCIPFVSCPASLSEVLKTHTGMPIVLLHPDENAIPMRELLEGFDEKPDELLIAIGPEGGWSPNELLAADIQHAVTATLGPRILRTETAALVAVSQILFHFE